MGEHKRFVRAVQSCNWNKAVEMLKKDSFDVDSQDKKGMTALMHVVKVDDTLRRKDSDDWIDKIVHLLLEKHADIHLTDKSKKCALEYAKNKWNKWIDKLTDPLECADRHDERGRGVVARLMMRLELVRKLCGYRSHAEREQDLKYIMRLIVHYIELGADINYPDNKDVYLSSHFDCVENDDNVVFRTFVSNGGDLTMSTSKSCSFVCKCSNYTRRRMGFTKPGAERERLKMIVCKGADIHRKCVSCRKTPMLSHRMFRYHRQRVKAVNMFIESTQVCDAVGTLIREFGGECVKCVK